MHNFTPVPAFVGGALIGLSATIFLLTHGKIAGISGLVGGVVRGSDRAMRIAFLLGLLVAGAIIRVLFPAAFATEWVASLPVAALAGLLVGVGTQVGNGCTSGHGVCGLSRLSLRSLVATCTFMGTAIATVWLVRR